MKKKITYKQAGVDILKADFFLKHIKVAKTGGVDAFGTLFDLVPYLKRYRNPVLVTSTDGVGTKLKIAQALNIHSTVGIDLVAMNVNDIICQGAQPLFFLDYIACGKISQDLLLQIMRGIQQGLRQAQCQLIGGETAQMPGMYKQGEYDLAGFCVGIVDRKDLIDPRAIRAGDTLLGCASSGIHSNGFSLVRKVFNRKELARLGKKVLIPTRLYVKPILSLLSQKRFHGAIKGIAHVTGGAFYHKAVKILPPGLKFVINKKSWRVPALFRLIQEKGCVAEKEMYRVFNMGIGMILVVQNHKVQQLQNHLKSIKLPTYVIGEVARSVEGTQCELI